MIQKSTAVGIGLAGVVLYAGKKELAVPPLHTTHLIVLAVLLVLAVALILNDDARILTLLKGLRDVALPFLSKKPDAGGPS